MSFEEEDHSNNQTSSDSVAVTKKNTQPTKIIKKSFRKSIAVTVPELVKNLGGNKVIQKVFETDKVFNRMSLYQLS